MSTNRTPEMPESADDGTVLQKRVDRREALGLLLGGLAAGAAAVGACTPLNAATPEERELKTSRMGAVHPEALSPHDRGGARRDHPAARAPRQAPP